MYSYIILVENVPFTLQISTDDDITNAVVEQLMMSCNECDSGIIDKQIFACFAESQTHMIYRARLEGTSERDSETLISLIEQWVRGGASIIVSGALMTVDSECSVAISSLGEGVCSTAPTTSTDSGQHLLIAVSGGLAALVIVLIIAITITFAVLSCRHRNQSVERAAK